MPVRSLRSAVLRWPDRESVHSAARRWAAGVARVSDPVVRVAYFGSYATGRWGVGSDLDILILVDSSEEPFERRGLQFRTSEIPVPCQVLVYTLLEWNRMLREGCRFARSVEAESVRLYQR